MDNTMSNVLALMDSMGLTKYFLLTLTVFLTIRFIRILIGIGLDTYPSSEKSKSYSTLQEEKEINHVIIQPYPKQKRRVYHHECKHCGGPAKYFTCEYCGQVADKNGIGGSNV